MGAAYGRADVTTEVSRRVSSSQSLQIYASNGVFGDSWRGIIKTLVIVYQHAGYDPRTVIVREGQSLTIKSRPLGCQEPSSNPEGNLKIMGAAYGLADVTDQVQSRVSNNRLDVSADSRIFGNAWSGLKSLVIVYQYGNGPYQTAIATEGNEIHIALAD